MNHKYSRREILKGTGASVALLSIPNALLQQSEAEIATRYDHAPRLRNVPIGVARGAAAPLPEVRLSPNTVRCGLGAVGLHGAIAGIQCRG